MARASKGRFVVDALRATADATQPSLKAFLDSRGVPYQSFYIVNAKEYAHGGYEVDQRSYYGPTLGDRIAEWAAQAVRGK